MALCAAMLCEYPAPAECAAGVVTSGNSLDYTAEDMARMVQHEAAVKVRACARCACLPLRGCLDAAALWLLLLGCWVAAGRLAIAWEAAGQRRALQKLAVCSARQWSTIIALTLRVQPPAAVVRPAHLTKPLQPAHVLPSTGAGDGGSGSGVERGPVWLPRVLHQERDGHCGWGAARAGGCSIQHTVGTGWVGWLVSTLPANVGSTVLQALQPTLCQADCTSSAHAAPLLPRHRRSSSKTCTRRRARCRRWCRKSLSSLRASGTATSNATFG